MEHQIHSRIKIVALTGPVASAATFATPSLDMAGFESLEYVIHVGTAFVGGGYDGTLQESDTGAFGGEETAVSADETLGGLPQVSIGDTLKVFRVGSIGKKRYQRLLMTETGTISAGIIGITAIQGDPKEMPVADQNT